MDMPTPCPECGEVVEFNDMGYSPLDESKMVCEDCVDKLEEIANSGFEIDHFGNKITWGFDPDSYLISFYLNGEEITCWSIEMQKEQAVDDFMKTWNLAQKSNPQK